MKQGRGGRARGRSVARDGESRAAPETSELGLHGGDPAVRPRREVLLGRTSGTGTGTEAKRARPGRTPRTLRPARPPALPSRATGSWRGTRAAWDCHPGAPSPFPSAVTADGACGRPGSRRTRAAGRPVDVHRGARERLPTRSGEPSPSGRRLARRGGPLRAEGRSLGLRNGRLVPTHGGRPASERLFHVKRTRPRSRGRPWSRARGERAAALRRCFT